jgi:hypothetical protein
MIDPITALATATAVFNGIKQAVAVGREAQDIFGQLSKWAGAVADVQEWIRGSAEAESKPSIFKKITFDKSATAEAFDTYAAQVQIRQMEAEIKHMFVWGELNHLGLDGYNEFIMLRRSVKEQRQKMVYDQLRRKQRFVALTTEWALIAVVLFLGGLILFHIISFIVSQSK